MFRFRVGVGAGAVLSFLAIPAKNYDVMCPSAHPKMDIGCFLIPKQ